SLSKKRCPYDNAVAESTYKVIKTEFVKQHNFKTLRELEIKLADYIHWYNNIRIHGSLNYLTPKLFRKRVANPL
ncbi:MAG: IS3 family transposase, partial [Fusobacteria bacterium]|nr:IS3 family transposase [Fusobacteriota bacterium]